MEGAPTPASGLRMQEIGDRLVVSFRPRRSRLVFLSIWLLGWTVGGVEAWLEVPRASPGGAAFLLFWLCGWFLGECAVICIIAWKLFGRLSLAVTPDEVEVRQQLACFSWLRRYEAGQVDEIAVGRMPDGEDGRHKDYSLRLSCDSQPLWVGEGMGEREAEYVASVVTARIQRTSWWNDHDEIRRRPAVDAAARVQFVAPAHTRGALLLAVVVAAVTLFGVPMLRRSQHHRTMQPANSAMPAHPFPARTGFSSARVYTQAVTSWALSSGGLILVGEPRCDAQATWTHWSCAALVSTDRPTRAADPAAPYRCKSTNAGGFTCELALRPRATADRP